MKTCINPDCPHQGSLQSDESFAIDQSREDGLALVCRDCNKERCKRWYKENKERKIRLALEYKAKHGGEPTRPGNRIVREPVHSEAKTVNEPDDYQMIRFSQSEWLFVLQQSQIANLTPEQFVRACVRDARVSHKRKVSNAN